MIDARVGRVDAARFSRFNVRGGRCCNADKGFPPVLELRPAPLLTHTIKNVQSVAEKNWLCRGSAHSAIANKWYNCPFHERCVVMLAYQGQTYSTKRQPRYAHRGARIQRTWPLLLDLRF